MTYTSEAVAVEEFLTGAVGLGVCIIKEGRPSLAFTVLLHD
jgi:hypothetical protein